MAFLDTAGVCVILVKRDPPINRVEENHGRHAPLVRHRQGALPSGARPSAGQRD
jgi:hypothetical protein